MEISFYLNTISVMRDSVEHVKNNDKSKKYILRGQRNVRYHDRILSKKKKSLIYNWR